jgi:DNA (cytosine-5)-methyltransferase 1
MSIPVIDLFAGPGGLGEGFSRSGKADFRVVVSIEKDAMAFETLRLRAAHRKLMESAGKERAAWREWDDILGGTPWAQVFEQLSNASSQHIRAACKEAVVEAWNIELGPLNREKISVGIRERLARHHGHAGVPSDTVLIGGPPCQAYSVVGRSRNRGTDGYRAEHDHRHFLYLEYLQVINEFRPAIFVMENVKGILTSRVAERQIFHTIMADLRRPDIACGSSEKLEYVLVALQTGSNNIGLIPEPEDFIVEAERYGVPQARHRVVICGIRRDVYERAGDVRALKASNKVNVGQVIGDLPELRPQLSFRGRGMQWADSLNLSIMNAAITELSSNAEDLARIGVAHLMQRVRARLQGKRDPGPGADRIAHHYGVMECGCRLYNWYRDRPLSLLANHESKAHMPTDIARYLFVSAYGHETGTSPNLSDFPIALLPEHRNVDKNSPGSSIFKDRFRVQLADRPSMTVTSHIAKDGHAFIHPDPLQCRSLTVREAARLQTFPDSYVFLGNRTSQYTQVGNAVPPFLALQIADLVADVLTAAGCE